MGKTSYQKEYRKNMTDEQKQKYREARKHKYHNMADEQKQNKKIIKKNIEKTRQMNKNKNIENLESINIIIWLLNKNENI